MVGRVISKKREIKERSKEIIKKWIVWKSNNYTEGNTEKKPLTKVQKIKQSC